MSVEGGEGGEQDQQQKQIEAPKEESAPREEIDLDTARAILQALVNTHESTITEATSLDRIAGYSVEQVREAERVVAQAIIDKHGKRDNIPRYTLHPGERRARWTGKHPADWLTARKDTPQGKLSLQLWDRSSRRVSLMLYNPYINNAYPLEEPDQPNRVSFGFEDKRPGGGKATLAGLDKGGLPLQKIRFMHRGLRWMNANMLNWDNPNAIMPEQLETVSGSPSQEEPPQIT